MHSIPDRIAQKGHATIPATNSPLVTPPGVHSLRISMMTLPMKSQSVTKTAKVSMGDGTE